MAELVALLQTVSAAAQLLETALRIMRRLTKAHEAQKSLAGDLIRYSSELNSIKSIVGVIEDEDTLRTASVSSEVFRLKDVEEKLVQHLKKLEAIPKGPAKALAHQFIRGSSDEKILAGIMHDLAQVKSALMMSIQVACVGVTRTIENHLVANTAAIKRIDDFLREELGSDAGLKIARLLKGRRPSNDGTVPLTRKDLAALNEETASQAGSSENAIDDASEFGSSQTLVSSRRSTDLIPPDKAFFTERIIVRNFTKDQAFMLCSPAGRDLWANIARIEIKDNKAEGSSTLIAYPTDMETLKLLLANRVQMAAAAAGAK